MDLQSVSQDGTGGFFNRSEYTCIDGCSDIREEFQGDLINSFSDLNYWIVTFFFLECNILSE